jgi:serine/threonine-protein kinase
VVQGRRPDNSVKEGQIAEQDPLAQSELPKNGSVSVVVSAGTEQVEVPNVVGKSRPEAEQALTAARLTLKEVLETGTCLPGTVCETKPSVGTSVDEKAPVSLVVAATATVPDVVNLYSGKAKEDIEKAGFKVGKIRWRSNDYKDANVVLSQEPPAGTVVAPGSEINLFVNEE